MRTLVRRPSPAMVVAVIALIVAMSATAVAVPGSNTIFKDDIRKDAVGKSELREQGDRDGGLTGAHVVESSLDKVPKAAAADRAELANDIAAPERYRVIGTPGNPAFQNGCTNQGGPSETAAFFKDREGIVQLRGAVTCPGTSQTAFQLPPGYRPAENKIHVELSITNAADGDSQVVVAGTGFGATGDGAVAAPNVSGAFRLDGISFRAVN
jgi:hypothetical protein